MSHPSLPFTPRASQEPSWRPPVVAVAIDPENALAGAEAVRDLRRRLPGIEVCVPAGAEDAVTAAALGEPRPPARSPVERWPWLREGGWLADSDLLVVPAAAPCLMPALQSAWTREIPVLAVRSAAGGVLPDLGVVWVDPDEGMAGLAAAVERLLGDAAEWETAVRRGRAQARRLAARGVEERADPLLGCPAGATARPCPESSEERSGWGSPPSRRVSVIIPTRGGPRAHHCLRAVRRAAGDLELQVFLVVTGGLDGSLPPCDEVVRCEPPFSWSKANNAAMRLAHHPLVLLLNDDCYFRRPGDLARLADRLEGCGHLIAVAPGAPASPPIGSRPPGPGEPGCGRPGSPSAEPASWSGERRSAPWDPWTSAS
jgi:hypothetical protein